MLENSMNFIIPATATLIALGIGYCLKRSVEDIGKRVDKFDNGNKGWTFALVGELLADFLLDLGDNIMGKENRKYLPFIGCIFSYVLIANLIGLIPGIHSPSAWALNGMIPPFNAGIAILVFVMYHSWGIKKSGAITYIKHFFGPIIWIAPLIMAIELLSHCVRPVSLSLRLYGNMTGDHAVLANFTTLTKVGIPVLFYGIGTFVSFMQAFVFSLLTMVYIGFAVNTDEEHHH